MPNYFKIDKFEGHIGRIDKREKYVLFSVAYNPGKKEENKPACWFQCKAVGKAAGVLQGMDKGEAISITNMMPETWKDRDGNDRWTWVVFDATKLERQDAGVKAPAASAAAPGFVDDDIPF